jgi:glutamate N-acetyltransferase/amino-acid N-acetyltransferase
LPIGYRAAGVHCGIKGNPQKEDLALVVSELPATAAGVYTQNKVCAAPVELDRERTPTDHARAVVINSGNANACTGERGLIDAEQMARLTAGVIGALQDEVLVLSTGVIGRFLPMDKIEQGIHKAFGKLGHSDAHLVTAARGMLTTDTRHKLAQRTIHLRGKTFHLAGMAKGAAMIGPHMATMLAVILTDVALRPADAQLGLKQAVDQSFNCISVDGHMSTNDTVLLLANGAVDSMPLAGGELPVFQAALNDLSAELARMIPEDGEGTTHVVTIDIKGAPNREIAHRVAKNIAESVLVKCAIHGADPNWGRIVSAAGYAGVPLNPHRLTLHINGFLLYEAGAPVEFNPQQVSASIRSNRDTSIVVDLHEGDATLRFWTTDLTAEYVRLNADYTT